MLVGLPLAGLWLTGRDLTPYLEFPPLTRHVPHHGFSWPAWLLTAGAAACAGGLLSWGVLQGRRRVAACGDRARRPAPVPWWGWLGAATGFASWVLAWTRFAWFAPLQPFTFAPLWVSFILVVNALCVRRSGRCPLTECPGRYAMLFPASAVFWWFFEYLNRFVQNWYYLGVEAFSPAGYVVSSTVAFSTVLPAVWATRDLLLTWPALGDGLRDACPVPVGWAKPAAIGLLPAAGVGLALVGVFPDHLFWLLWVSPLLIVLALQVLHGRCPLLDRVAAGDWRDLVAGPLAGLVCGGFWELWNVFSLPRWEYAVPFVDRFHVFAMPLLGYAGYLPFGLECLVMGELVLGCGCGQAPAGAAARGERG